MELAEALATWDGKSTAHLYQAYHTHAPTTEDLARLMATPAHEVAATWLFKHALEEGSPPPTPETIARVLKAAQSFESWEAILHILQSLPLLPLPKSTLPSLEALLHYALESDAKFVRAWAYSGWSDLAKADPTRKEDAAKILKAAHKKETAPSILARIRKAEKALEHRTHDKCR